MSSLRFPPPAFRHPPAAGMSDRSDPSDESDIPADSDERAAEELKED